MKTFWIIIAVAVAAIVGFWLWNRAQPAKPTLTTADKTKTIIDNVSKGIAAISGLFGSPSSVATVPATPAFSDPVDWDSISPGSDDPSFY